MDLIAEVATHVAYYKLCEKLKGAGFKEDPEMNCRWRLGTQKVDVMPTDEKILGYSNRWYSNAIDRAQRMKLPSGQAINVVTAPMFVATKLEAFYGRGQGDFASHDIEDIVVLTDGREELAQEVLSSPDDLKGYLATEIETLLADRTFVESLPWHFATDDTSQGRIEVVVARLRKVAGV